MTSVRAGAYGVALAELAVAAGPAPARALGGMALVFVLPGLALTSLLQPRRAFDSAERGLAVLGLSVSVTVVTGLAIAGLGIPLTRVSFVVGLGATCAVWLAAAAARAPGRSDVVPTVPHLPGLPKISRAAAGLLACAALGIAAAIGIGVALQRSHGPGFTQLWALRDGRGRVSVGLRSHEKSAAVYRLRVSVPAVGSREARIELRPGEQWIARGAVAQKRRVTVTLAKAGRAGVYRSVHLAPQAGS
jgi:uncharacterized membrane protein